MVAVTAFWVIVMMAVLSAACVIGEYSTFSVELGDRKFVLLSLQVAVTVGVLGVLVTAIARAL